MSNQSLIKKIEKIEKAIEEFTKPKQILGKIYIDEGILKKLKKAIFDFDIEKFISKKELKIWKK